MRGLTGDPSLLPHKEKKRQEAVQRVANDWEIDTQNYEIRLKRKPWYVSLWNFILLKRYPVRELYYFVYDHFHHPDRLTQLMPIEFPLDHDNIKKPAEVPYNFVMQGGWEIPSDYLPKLINGPLISEDGKTLLVKAGSRLDLVSRFTFRLLSVLTIPGGLYATWQFVLAIFKKSL